MTQQAGPSCFCFILKLFMVLCYQRQTEALELMTTRLLTPGGEESAWLNCGGAVPGELYTPQLLCCPYPSYYILTAASSQLVPSELMRCYPKACTLPENEKVLLEKYLHSPN